MSEDSAPKRRKYNPPPPYVSVTTVASLHLTQEDRGALERHDKLISRKSFRVLPGLAIPVWPHQLESVLLEGLEAYEALYNSGEPQKNRNAGRNTFLSSYIFERTNQRRNPKQIGSRIQQLKQVTTDRRLKQLLRGYPRPKAGPARPLTIPSLSVDAPSAKSDDTSATSEDTPRPPRTPLLVSIPLASLPYPAPLPTIRLESTRQTIHLGTLPEFQPHTCVLRGMDPTVAVLSTCRLRLYCLWEVFWRGEPYWVSSAVLTLDKNTVGGGKWRYTTSLASDLWPDICEEQDVGHWTIKQLLFSEDDGVLTRDNPQAPHLQWHKRPEAPKQAVT
ncbi:hypothetical protein C8J57DRAFT_1322886 [Mycena rebaudengoi]|nr:hypothetical protein C8J57DRAFT_1322886 [Mycena rebaudengoi]